LDRPAVKADERRRRLSEVVNTTLGWVGDVVEGKVPKLAVCPCGVGFWTLNRAQKYHSVECAVESAKVARAAKVARPASNCRRCGDHLPVVCPCCAAELGLGAESILDVEFGAG
jgi:hypothetical protein